MTTRRSFLRMFAAVPIVGAAVCAAAKVEPTTELPRMLRTPEGLRVHPWPVPTHSTGEHTHMICNCAGAKFNHGCPVHKTSIYRI